MEKCRLKIIQGLAGVTAVHCFCRMDVRGLPTIFGKDCKMKNYLRILIARIRCSSQIPSSETSLVYNSLGSNCVFKSFIGRLVDLQLALLFHSSARWRNAVSKYLHLWFHSRKIPHGVCVELENVEYRSDV